MPQSGLTLPLTGPLRASKTVETTSGDLKRKKKIAFFSAPNATELAEIKPTLAVIYIFKAIY